MRIYDSGAKRTSPTKFFPMTNGAGLPHVGLCPKFLFLRLFWFFTLCVLHNSSFINKKLTLLPNDKPTEQKTEQHKKPINGSKNIAP